MVFSYIFQGFWRVMHMLPVGIAIALAVSLCGYKTIWKKDTLIYSILCTYLLGLFDITGMFLGNEFDVTLFYESLCSVSMPFKYANIQMLFLNMLLFVPVGLLLCLILKSHKYVKSIVLCNLLSLAIEVVQGFTGRFLEIDDVIMNTLGGMLGVFLFCILKKIKIHFPTKNEIIVLVLSAFVFLNGTIVFDCFIDHNNKHSGKCNYLSVYDKYDSDNSTISRLYNQQDSLERLIKCDGEVEEYFQGRMSIYSHQQLDFEDGRECIEITAIEKNTYKEANINGFISQGNGITEFEYSPEECQILLPEKMNKYYSVGDEFEAYYLGFITLKFKVNGFIDDKDINIADETIDLSERAIIPLFDNVEETDMDSLSKKIILTQRIESTISYTDDSDKRDILSKIGELSDKYNLELLTLDMADMDTTVLFDIPVYVSIVMLLLSFILYAIGIYRKNLRCDNKNKFVLVNICFWECVLGFVYIMVKMGIYDSGNAVISTILCIFVMVFTELTMNTLKQPPCLKKF